MVNRIVRFFEAVLTLLRALENVLVDLAAAVAPWLAPLPSAYLTFSHMTGVLAFPWWVAGAAALCIELLGLSAVQTAFSLWNYNQEKRLTDRAAPLLIALMTGAAYLVVVMLLVLALDEAPLAVKAARAGLASLSVVGAVVLALRASHSRRLAAIQAEREERRQARQEKRLDAERPGKMDMEPLVYKDWRELPNSERYIVARLTTRQIQKRYKVPERTARHWRRLAINLVGEANNGHHIEDPLPLAK